jgi:hypothetical protein
MGPVRLKALLAKEIRRSVARRRRRELTEYHRGFGEANSTFLNVVVVSGTKTRRLEETPGIMISSNALP